ncbi:ATPase, T2SS/T4P/T4SS family [Thermodesulfobacteriota bacterium]
MPYMEIFNPKNGTTTLYDIVKETIKIGRLSDNDIILADDRVSRYHAEIIRHSDKKIIIQDLNSANGTIIRGRKVSTKKLKNELKIDIGRMKLTFKAGPFPEERPFAPPPSMPEEERIYDTDDQNYETVISETFMDLDTHHDATGVEKVSASKLDSRREAIARKLKARGEKTALPDEKTEMAPPPPPMERAETPDRPAAGQDTTLAPPLSMEKIELTAAPPMERETTPSPPPPVVQKTEVSLTPPTVPAETPSTDSLSDKKIKTVAVHAPFSTGGLQPGEAVEPAPVKGPLSKELSYRTRSSNLLDLFHGHDVISTEELTQFRDEVRKSSETAYQVISKKSLYYRRGGMDALSKYFHLPYMESDDEIVKRYEKTSINENSARRCNALSIREEEGSSNGNIFVIMADPTDIYAIDELSLLVNKPVKPIYFSTPETIKKAISRVFKTTISTKALDLASINVEIGKKELTVEEVTGFPIVDMVNYFINKAMTERASDVHFEPTEHFLVIRNRIDGVLHEVAALPEYLHPEIVSRIKIICEMNVAEKRLPQDGRFSVTVSEKQVDVRVSTYPTVHGEKVVLRLLEQETVITDINRLGMEEGEVELLLEKITSPFGMVLLTGPTGCGKTTTLYACISMINSQDINILTVEDPVEYKIPGIYQMQANEKIGLTFASGLRTMLRQDPDVIMVGEIRDHETAEIAIRAAITGHIVFSTLHTNDAVGIVVRLADMGVDPFLISSSLSLAIAQRLYRTVCEDCRIYVEPKIILDRLKEEGITEDRLRRLGLEISEDREYSMGKGCPKCRGTGYFGRRALFEIFNLTLEAKDLIVSKDYSESELKKLAVSQGMTTLVRAGRLAVERGLTTVDEVIRVCGEG